MNIKYSYIDIEIFQKTKSKYLVEIHSPAGELKREINATEVRTTLNKLLPDIQSNHWLSDLPDTGAAVQSFGKWLFETFLGDEILPLYRSSLNLASAQNKVLCLRLHLDPPELSNIPWELLYDPDSGSYVALANQTPLVRYTEVPQVLQPLRIRSPLRILAMGASPQDLPTLDLKSEREEITRLFQELSDEGLVQFSWVEGETAEDLQRALRSHDWHIFHFSGHGTFDDRTGQGALFLADEHGLSVRLRAQDLAQMLRNRPSLRLVVLNACQGSEGSMQDRFSSTAGTLARYGLPAILAMQQPISNEGAGKFSRVFYQALAEGWPLEFSLTEARLALAVDQNNTEWAVPTLYLRAAEGQIFSLVTKPTAGPRKLRPEKIAALHRTKIVQVTRGDRSRTGIVINPQGLVLTVQSSVDADGDISITSYQQGTYSAQVLDQAEDKNLALLRVAASGQDAFKLRVVGSLSLPSQVTLLGFDERLHFVTVDAQVDASTTVPNYPFSPLLVAAAPIPKTFGGAAAFDPYGNLVGTVVSLYINPATQKADTAYILPVSALEAYVDEALRHAQ